MNPNNRDLSAILDRITNKLERDKFVSESLDYLRAYLQVNRVVLYCFYTRWKGIVTFESISHLQYSVIGSSGPNECFQQEYAALYLAGRIFCSHDIEVSDITPCHREFLRNLQVRSNLVVPVIANAKLWGLLVAHHCEDLKHWNDADINTMSEYAQKLSKANSISSMSSACNEP